jgi:hypothetical protein
VPYLGGMIRRELQDLSERSGFQLHFAHAYWTPSLAPRQAYRLEEKQIQRQFQLPALVSLTDHDDIRVGMLLRVLTRFHDVPVSTEWTIPFETTFFHLGVHNMPANAASGWMQELRAFTDVPRPRVLQSILEKLNSHPDVLVVLNHPLWDEKGIGAANHLHALHQFLQRHGRSVHALEVNGMRSWQENQQVLQLGSQIGLPVVAGGDRHGREPNAILNLSNAANFPEFVEEVRKRRFSHVVFMPQYRAPLKMRVLQTLIEIIRNSPGNLYYRFPGNPAPVSLTSLWIGNDPWNKIPAWAPPSSGKFYRALAGLSGFCRISATLLEPFVTMRHSHRPPFFP